jgi:hypothetical protein
MPTARPQPLTSLSLHSIYHRHLIGFQALPLPTPSPSRIQRNATWHPPLRPRGIPMLLPTLMRLPPRTLKIVSMQTDLSSPEIVTLHLPRPLTASLATQKRRARLGDCVDIRAVQMVMGIFGWEEGGRRLALVGVARVGDDVFEAPSR